MWVSLYYILLTFTNRFHNVFFYNTLTGATSCSDLANMLIKYINRYLLIRLSSLTLTYSLGIINEGLPINFFNIEM